MTTIPATTFPCTHCQAPIASDADGWYHLHDGARLEYYCNADDCDTTVPADGLHLTACPTCGDASRWYRSRVWPTSDSSAAIAAKLDAYHRLLTTYETMSVVATDDAKAKEYEDAAAIVRRDIEHRSADLADALDRELRTAQGDVLPAAERVAANAELAARFKARGGRDAALLEALQMMAQGGAAFIRTMHDELVLTTLPQDITFCGHGPQAR